jgi:hypothetical protein
MDTLEENNDILSSISRRFAVYGLYSAAHDLISSASSAATSSEAWEEGRATGCGLCLPSL